MIRRPIFIFTVLASVVVIILFRVKYQVSALEIEQHQLNLDIAKARESLHMLRAEWNYLNDPLRLQKLCEKYLPSLKPIHSSQLITMQDLIQQPTPPMPKRSLTLSNSKESDIQKSAKEVENTKTLTPTQESWQLQEKSGSNVSKKNEEKVKNSTKTLAKEKKSATIKEERQSTDKAEKSNQTNSAKQQDKSNQSHFNNTLDNIISQEMEREVST